MSEEESGGRPVGVQVSVLVVDDHDDAREVMLAFLRANGFAADGARDGIQALHRLGDGGSFDLVILDLIMPRLDGHEFLRRLRALPGAQGQVPVVVVTGTDVAADGVEGASAWFRKPAPLEDLLETVQRLGSRS